MHRLNYFPHRPPLENRHTASVYHLGYEALRIHDPPLFCWSDGQFYVHPTVTISQKIMIEIQVHD